MMIECPECGYRFNDDYDYDGTCPDCGCIVDDYDDNYNDENDDYDDEYEEDDENSDDYDDDDVYADDQYDNDEGYDDDDENDNYFNKKRSRKY